MPTIKIIKENMRQKFNRLSFFLSLAILSLGGAVAYAPSTFAINTYSTYATSNASAASNNSTTNQAATPNPNAAAAKQRLCTVKKEVVTNIMNRIDTRFANQLTLFSTIATRVETFYTNKGKTLSNYATLVAAVNTAETQAKTDLANLKAGSTLDCSVAEPRAQVNLFQTNLTTAKTDLTNLKTAVRNLIVAVAGANNLNLPSTSSQGGTN